MAWLNRGEDIYLTCDGCKARLEYPGPRAMILQAARAHGWHVFSGQSLTGKDLDVHLCEDCVGSPRAKLLPKHGKLVEDIPLWPDEEGL